MRSIGVVSSGWTLNRSFFKNFNHEIWCMCGFTLVCDTIGSNGETMLECNRITCDAEIMSVCEAMLGRAGEVMLAQFLYY